MRRLSLLALSIAACAGHHHAFHLPQPSHELTVTGSGEASAAPDIARVNVGVELRAANVNEAAQSANQRMSAVTAALKQAGVADKDLRTHDLAIVYEQASPPPPLPLEQDVQSTAKAAGPKAVRPKAAAVAPAPEAPRGYYRVTNVLEVTIRDLNAIGKLLGAAVDAGANDVLGLSFELENNDALVAMAREKAVERAKRNAVELARLAGVTLGKVISVSEGERATEPGGRDVMIAMRSSDVPIERGQVTVTESVEIVYALP